MVLFKKIFKVLERILNRLKSNIILFGCKGSGKSTIGKLLAEKLQKKFIDTDLLFYKPVKEIYQECGEEEFRCIESNIIFSLMQVSSSVIAVGGGAVIDSKNVKVLKNLGKMIYLKVELETILNRNVSHVGMPLEKLYEERMAIYESIDACVIDANRSKDLIVEEIINGL